MRQRGLFAACDAVVDQLVAGEKTLVTAVGDIRSLNFPGEWSKFYALDFGGCPVTEAEAIAYRALHNAPLRTKGLDPLRRAEVLAGIEAQYTTLFGHAPPSRDS